MTIRVPCLLLIAVCVSIVGCRQEPQIESYTVPKEAATRVVAAAADTAATERMLAAILPAGGKAWFFKVTAPVATLDPLAEQVNEFFASVRPPAEKPVPTWQLPDGWQEQPGSGLRAATIMIPTSTEPLEISVTGLPWSGSPGELLSNVNRWRGQLQLAEIDQSGLVSCTRELKAGDATLTIVDLRGRLQSGGMMPPFAGGRASGTAPPATRSPVREGDPSLPPGHPPITAPAIANSAPFTYETPPGWEPLAPSGMRKAAFRIADGNQQALLTVIDFPADAGPMMADPLANVRRWRGEVGLPELADAELKETITPILIDGLTAQWVDATPAEADAQQSKIERATLAAMLTRGDDIWFFKLTGPRDLVTAERDNLEAFLKSIRFSDAGANDGHQ